MGKYKYDWKMLQKAHNEGASWRDLRHRFGVSDAIIHKAIKRGDFVSRSSKEGMQLYLKKGITKKHTVETKNKISVIRRKYLEAHPDKVPYLINHSSKQSYSEKIFESAISGSNITGGLYNLQQGIYSYDFGFPQLKLDIEIDGSTHLQEKVMKIDKRRDEWTRSRGWEVLRFTGVEVKIDVVNCINRFYSYSSSFIAASGSNMEQKD